MTHSFNTLNLLYHRNLGTKMLKETKIIIKFTLYFQAPPSLCIIKIDIGIIAGFYGKNLII